jgi:inositol phosphorylceramide mannosyltransferase catalytic subunit
MNSRIPKRIIHVWGAGEHDLSLLSQAAVANVRLLNPDFEYLFFDDNRIEDFVNEHFSEYRTLFHSLRFPIQRYDLFRYLAIYHFGGFYLDLDVFLASSLSDLLDFGCVFPFEELTISIFLRREYGMDWEIANYAFGAAAGHPFIQAIIGNCVRAHKDPEWAKAMMRSIPRMFREDFYVFNATGPGLVSRTLAEYQDAAKQVKVLFPENVCDSTNWHRFGMFGVHLMASTWLKRKGFLRRQLARLWMLQTRKRLLKESLSLGESRSLEFRRKV